jgi:hypothetical protein
MTTVAQVYKDVEAIDNKRLEFFQRKAESIAILGIEPGQVATVERNGEYYGFSIKALEYIKPIIMKDTMLKVLRMVMEDRIPTAMKVLHIPDSDLGTFYYILNRWLRNRNKITPPSDFVLKEKNPKDDNIDMWVDSDLSTPVIGRVAIEAIGKGIVPEDWIGREYENCYELHEDMDTLPWRKNKPPVTFCAIYGSLIIQGIGITNVWLDYKQIKKLDISIAHTITIGKDKCDIDKGALVKHKSHRFIIASYPINTKHLLFSVDYDSIIAPKAESTKISVGLMASRLQKCIRRGSGSVNVLVETLKSLSRAMPYNIPEQQFLRVSAVRQMVWRLLISVIEDTSPYLPGSGYLSMKDLACLSLFCQVSTDAFFQKWLVEKIIYTAMLIQNNKVYSYCWENEKTPDSIKEKYNNNDTYGLMLVHDYMPKMRCDGVLILKIIGYIQKYPDKIKKFEEKSVTSLLKFSEKKIEEDALYASYDMHSHPLIILELQGSIPFLPNSKYTTRKLSAFIWENSSSINYRKNNFPHLQGQELVVLKTLRQIQERSINGVSKYPIFTPNKTTMGVGPPPNKIPELVSRTAFMLLFGRTVKLPHHGKILEACIDLEDLSIPVKIKENKRNKESVFLEGAEKKEALGVYLNVASNRELTVPNPPDGYEWKFDKNSIRIGIDKDFKFFANNNRVNPVDASNILYKMMPYDEIQKVPKILDEIIDIVLYNCDSSDYEGYYLNLIMMHIHKLRRQNNDVSIYAWTRDMNIPLDVWRDILVSFYDVAEDGQVFISHVDNQGRKLDNAVNYQYEGVKWRIFNMLTMLYPFAIKPAARMRYSVNKTATSYVNMMTVLRRFVFGTPRIHSKMPKLSPITMKTDLWVHQQLTVDKVVTDVIKLDKKGAGDASDVGAGKTLTALSIMAHLYNHNLKKDCFGIYKGFAVLLPTTHLYNTWLDELTKHTSGFHILQQESNGKIGGDVKHNTILITTIGRMRDHPISNMWIQVVIDECLTVQNKDALQTKEAWRQSITSQYGIYMMSATFFRSRFDKLYYMLKMLRSQLPEVKEYLDTILVNTIVCNIPETKFIWTSMVTTYDLLPDVRQKYEKILRIQANAEKIYGLLQAFIAEYIDYVDLFAKKLKDLKNRRVLVYAKSKDEANTIAARISSVTRYPDKSGQNVVLSYTEGTYGLNDLVIYDTILSRPPDPDKLPQMKGRLSRYGQTKDKLHLEYILLKDTIEEASHLRLEIANSFHQGYIMPLASFYDLALSKR